MTLTRDEAALGIELLTEYSGDDEVRTAGHDPAPRPAAAALDAGRGRRGAARTTASTPSRQPSRATSRSSASSRCATPTDASSTRCPAPPTCAASTSSGGASPLARRDRTTGTVLVVHTPHGFAARARRCDRRRALPEVAGTIAGENTVFVAARDGIAVQSSPTSSTRSLRGQRDVTRSSCGRDSRRRCRSASASASRSRAGSTRAARSRGCASTARSRTRSPPTSASTTSRTSTPSREGARGTAPRKRCSSTARRRSRARARRAPVRRLPHPDRRPALLQHDAARARGDRDAARARDGRARRRDLGRRLDVQGQRHRALLPLRAARERAPADLQAVARRRVRRRARRPDAR